MKRVSYGQHMSSMNTDMMKRSVNESENRKVYDTPQFATPVNEQYNYEMRESVLSSGLGNFSSPPNQSLKFDAKGIKAA